MKSIKELSWLVDEPTYRADEALSYSIISRYEQDGFGGLEHLRDQEDSSSLRFGSMVDCLIFDGADKFNEKYFVCTLQDTTDDLKKVCESIAAELGSLHDSLYDVPDKDIVRHLNANGVYQNTNWKDETKANKVRESANGYYTMLLKAGNRKIVDMDTCKDVNDCVNVLKNNHVTEKYFSQNNTFDGVERQYQLKFKGEYNGKPVRCMIDGLYIDHKNKYIIPFDLKTSSEPEYDFPKAFLKWRYKIVC